MEISYRHLVQIASSFHREPGKEILHTQSSTEIFAKGMNLQNVTCLYWYVLFMFLATLFGAQCVFMQGRRFDLVIHGAV